jgi:hypothetical protein
MYFFRLAIDTSFVYFRPDRWFAAEIIGNLLDLEPRRWRKPRRMDYRLNKERVDKFKKKYAKYDWTSMAGN